MIDWSVSYDKSRNNFGYVYEHSVACKTGRLFFGGARSASRKIIAKKKICLFCRLAFGCDGKQRKMIKPLTAVPLSPQVVCEPAERTKLQLLNCTQCTEQFLVGKEAISSGDTVALALLLLEVFTACPKSQTLTLQSRPPEAKRVPSALKARLYTVSVCPRSSLIILPADKSHRRMRRSSPADTRYWPSGEIARSWTEPYKQQGNNRRLAGNLLSCFKRMHFWPGAIEKLLQLVSSPIIFHFFPTNIPHNYSRSARLSNN